MPAPDTPEFSRHAGLFRVLASQTCLKILQLLHREGEASAGEVCEHVGFSMTATSVHLRKMRIQRLIRSDRRGQRSIYSLAPLGARFAGLIASLDGD